MKIFLNAYWVSIFLIYSMCLHATISHNTFLPRSFASYQYYHAQDETRLYLHNQFRYKNNRKYSLNKLFLSSSLIHQSSFTFKGVKSYNRLGALPFWSGTNYMTVGTNSGQANVDGYQFGLGDLKVNESGYAGSIKLQPQFSVLGLSNQLYYIHNTIGPGVYFKINLPLCMVSMKHNMTENVIYDADRSLSSEQITLAPGSTTIHYQDPEYTLPTDRASSLGHAWLGGYKSCDTVDGNILKRIRLRKGRMFLGKQTVTRLADMGLSLGYNCIHKNDGFLSVGAHVSFPTGNVPTGDYILEPIAGRAGALAVGGECSGAKRFWMQDRDTRYVDLAMQGYLLSLCANRKPNFRSFDLKQNGLGSKYLLLQEYSYEIVRSATNIAQEIAVPVSIHPAINYTTLPVLSKIAVEGALLCMLDFHSKHFDVGLGVEYWGRTREQLKIDIPTVVQERHPSLNRFAVLGRQHSQYLIDGVSTILATNYCQPNAQITKSLDPVVLVGSGSLPDGSTINQDIKDGSLSSNRIPEKLDEALDIKGAEFPAVSTVTLYAHVGYSWLKKYHVPSIMMHANVELSSRGMPLMYGLGVTATLNF